MKVSVNNDGNVVYTMSREENDVVRKSLRLAVEELNIVVNTANGKEDITNTDGCYSKEALNGIQSVFGEIIS